MKKNETLEPMKLVRLVDEPEVLRLEDSDRFVEVPESDNGSACSCGCGCTERYYSIASSYCRWCQTGACDCSPSAMASEKASEDFDNPSCPWVHATKEDQEYCQYDNHEE